MLYVRSAFHPELWHIYTAAKKKKKCCVTAQKNNLTINQEINLQLAYDMQNVQFVFTAVGEEWKISSNSS